MVSFKCRSQAQYLPWQTDRERKSQWNRHCGCRRAADRLRSCVMCMDDPQIVYMTLAFVANYINPFTFMAFSRRLYPEHLTFIPLRVKTCSGAQKWKFGVPGITTWSVGQHLGQPLSYHFPPKCRPAYRMQLRNRYTCLTEWAKNITDVYTEKVGQ